MEKNLILTRARSAEISHDFTTATRLYKQLLDGDASNVDYLKSLGSIYVQAGEDEKAIPYYEQIIAYYPHYIDAMNSLGAIYRRLKRYNESISILQRALEEDRQVPSVNYNLGFTYKEMGNFDDAIEAFESVIAVNPNDVLAHNHLGTIYLSLKEYQKSISAFKRGLQIDPNHPILNYNLARCYEAEKSYSDAIRCYGLTLKTKPGWTDAIRDFSNLLIKCQKNKEAQELVQQSIKLYPNDANLLHMLGKIYINLYDYDSATKALKEANKKKGENVKILTTLAEALEKGEKVETAIDTILDALQVEPDNKDAKKQYAHSLLTAKEYEQAHETVDELYNQDGGNKDLQVLDLYGQYYICNNEDEKAEEMFNQIQKINHHYKDYLISAAERYSECEKFEKAEKYANKYVGSRPQNPDGYMTLGKIYEKKGDLIGAKNFFGKSTTLRKPNILAQKKIESLTEKLNTPDMLTQLQEVVPEEVEKEETPIPEEEKQEETVSTDFDFAQMGDSIPEVEESKEEFFEKLADNVDDKFAKEEEEDTFEIQDPDKLEFADEETTFDFDQNEEEVDPLKEDEGKNFFGEEEAEALANATNAIGEALPEMEKMQDNAKESAYAAREAANDAQRLMQELQDKQMEMQEKMLEQQQSMQEQLMAQQEMLNEQMKQNAQNMVKEAVCDFLEQDNEPVANNTPVESAPAVKETPAVETPVFDDEPVVEESPVIETPVFDDVSTENETPEDFGIDVESENETPVFDDEPVVEEAPVIETPVFNAVSTENETPEDFGIDVDSEIETPEDFGIEMDSAVSDNSDVEIQIEEVPVEIDNSIETDLPEEIITEDTEAVSEEEILFMTEDDILEESEEIAEETETETDVLENDEEIIEETEDGIETDVVEEGDETEEETSFMTEDEILEESIDDSLFDENRDEPLSVELMLEKIQRILNDDDFAKENKEKLELFRTLRILSNFLPEADKNSFQCCRMRMMIEYIIDKLSGKPGLLLTAQSLIKSGVLGEEYEKQLSTDCQQELSNELIRKVLIDMKGLSDGLDDKDLAKSLCITADNILEQIELKNQQAQIF